ncbi:MAG: patatin-like phospholipase family protein [bacterium]
MTNTIKGNLKHIVSEMLTKTHGNKYRSGLVLSGGAAHGFAHLGVLQAMEEMDIVPDIISGASAGAIVGSLYADGFSTEEILEMFANSNLLGFVSLKVRKQGLFDISGLRKIMKNNLRTKRIEDLKIPLVIATTNLDSATTAYFDKGNLVDVVLASSSIPVLFNPVVIGEKYYVDGGITDNFPVEPLVDVCEEITGVNVNPVGGFDPTGDGLLQLAVYTFHISVYSRVDAKRKYLDHFVEPKELASYSYLDLSAAREMSQLGYEEAKKVLGDKYAPSK